MKRKFLYMLEDILKVISSELVVKNPQGDSKKKEAEKGAKNMEKFCFHRAQPRITGYFRFTV
jgi:hypothetical protein